MRCEAVEICIVRIAYLVSPVVDTEKANEVISCNEWIFFDEGGMLFFFSVLSFIVVCCVVTVWILLIGVMSFRVAGFFFLLFFQ